jgi:ABC-2 type transport system permease protein
MTQMSLFVSSTLNWWRCLYVMIIKELLQLARDTPLIVFFIFAFTLNIVMGGGRTGFELKNAILHVTDSDKSATSRELINRFRAPYYLLHGENGRTDAGTRLLDRGTAMVLMEIPEDFERAILQRRPTAVHLEVDTSNSVLGLLAASYAQQIAAGFATDIALAQAGITATELEQLPAIREVQRSWFNPNQNSAWFFSIGEMVMMVTLLSILLSTAAMAREKERGTIEQLLVSPLSPLQILLPKVLAMTLVVTVGTMASVFGVLGPVFNIPIRGSLPLFFAITAIYGFTSSGLGLFAATVTRNLSQAGLLAIFLFVPIILFSGIHTPDEGMPRWLHTIVLFNPMSHYIDATYSILLRGAGLDLIWDSVLVMGMLGSTVFAFGVWRFRRQFE